MKSTEDSESLWTVASFLCWQKKYYQREREGKLGKEERTAINRLTAEFQKRFEQCENNHDISKCHHQHRHDHVLSESSEDLISLVSAEEV